MSRICDICGKGYLKGNLVPRGIGRRVTRRTITRQQPNLRTKRFFIGDRFVKLRVCSSCLSRIKFEENLLQQEQDEVSAGAKSKVEPEESENKS